MCPVDEQQRAVPVRGLSKPSDVRAKAIHVRRGDQRRSSAGLRQRLVKIVWRHHAEQSALLVISWRNVACFYPAQRCPVHRRAVAVACEQQLIIFVQRENHRLYAVRSAVDHKKRSLRAVCLRHALLGNSNRAVRHVQVVGVGELRHVPERQLLAPEAREAASFVPGHMKTRGVFAFIRAQRFL